MNLLVNSLPRLLWCWHQGGVHWGGAVRSAAPLPTDLRHIPEAPAGRLLHRRQQLRLCGGHEEDVAGLPPHRWFACQTPVACGPPAAGHRPARHPWGSAEAVPSRRAGDEEEERARWVRVRGCRVVLGPDILLHLVYTTPLSVVFCMSDLTSGILDDGLMCGGDEGSSTSSISMPSTSKSRNFLHFARWVWSALHHDLDQQVRFNRHLYFKKIELLSTKIQIFPPIPLLLFLPTGVQSNTQRPTVLGCSWQVVLVLVRPPTWLLRSCMLWSVSLSTAWTLQCCLQSAAPPRRKPVPRWLLSKHHADVDLY